MKKKKLLTDRSGTLQEQMMEEAAKRLSDDIDFEVMMGFFMEAGWTKVKLEPMTWEHGAEIDKWVAEQVDEDKIIHRGLVWVFKDVKDANWFKIRWL